MILQSDHENPDQETIKYTLIKMGLEMGKPKVSCCQAIEAILSSPRVADWIGSSFFQITTFSSMQYYYEILNQNIELFEPSFEKIDWMKPWGSHAEYILKEACEFNCFKIVEKLIENPCINNLIPSGQFHSTYVISSETLRQCLVKCAQAGYKKLADQINVIIAKRNQLCQYVTFKAQVYLIPTIQTFVNSALYGEQGSLISTLRLYFNLEN